MKFACRLLIKRKYEGVFIDKKDIFSIGLILAGLYLFARPPGRGNSAFLGRTGDVRYADHFETIQAAINDLSSGPGVVLIPPGIYETSAPLTLNNNQYLVGSGIGITTIVNTTTNVIEKAPSLSTLFSAKVANLTIRCGTPGVPGHRGIDMTGWRSCRIYNVEVLFGGAGIYLSRGAGGEACYFNSIENIKTNGCTRSVHLDHSSGYQVNANFFKDLILEDSTGTSSIGVDLAGIGNRFEHVYVGGHSDAGVRMSGGTERNIFTGLYIESSPTFGLDLGTAGLNPPSRRNLVFGLHFDEQTKNRDPLGQLEIYDSNGINPLRSVGGGHDRRITLESTTAGASGTALAIKTPDREWLLGQRLQASGPVFEIVDQTAVATDGADASRLRISLNGDISVTRKLSLLRG